MGQKMYVKFLWLFSGSNSSNKLSVQCSSAQTHWTNTNRIWYVGMFWSYVVFVIVFIIVIVMFLG